MMNQNNNTLFNFLKKNAAYSTGAKSKKNIDSVSNRAEDNYGRSFNQSGPYDQNLRSGQTPGNKFIDNNSREMYYGTSQF